MKKEKKTFFIILGVVIVTGLIFSLYAYSKIRSIRELRASIEKTGTDRAREIAKESDSTSGARKSIPQKMWTTEFIETAYNASKKYGIRDQAFEQKSSEGPRKQGQGNSRLSLQSYPVRMTFHAGYREMAEFIQELQGLDKLVTIDSLKVNPEKSSLAVEMTVSTYAMEGR